MVSLVQISFLSRRVVRDVVLGRVAGGELPDRDAVAGDVGDDVADDHVVVRPGDEVEAGAAHLREDVSLEVDVIGVHHADAGRRASDRLLVVGGGRHVVLARLPVEEARLAGAHVGRVGERDPLEPEIAGLAAGAGPGDAHHRLDHRRHHHRLGHVLARARLVGEDALALVEVPLAGLVEELERVLEVVAVLGEPAELPAQVRERPREHDRALGALDLESGGAARRRGGGEAKGAVPPAGHDVHLDLREVVPARDLRARDLDVLGGVVGAGQPVERERAVRPEVRAPRADRLDAVDVELPERRGDPAGGVDAVAARRVQPVMGAPPVMIGCSPV